jgi:uncharacterized membrane protein YdjX (TVP38/TMEM64 family)
MMRAMAPPLPLDVPSASQAAVRRRLLVGALVLAAVVVAARLAGVERLVGPAVAGLRGLGLLGAALLALAYVPAALAGLPMAPLGMAAGAAFGVAGGAAIAIPANALAACLPFLVGRLVVGRDPEALARGEGRVARAARALGKGGFRLVLLLRLSWVAPFGVLNYAFGATPCRLRDFVLGTLLGSAPVSVGYAWAGAALLGG